jgi:hypothetical protein
MATTACPYCKEEIQEEAKKCRHCGELLDPELRRKEKSAAIQDTAKELAIQSANSDATQALWFGILGFVCFGIIFGPLAIMKGGSANRTLAQHKLPSNGSATAGRILGIIVTTIWVIAILGQVAVLATRH